MKNTNNKTAPAASSRALLLLELLELLLERLSNVVISPRATAASAPSTSSKKRSLGGATGASSGTPPPPMPVQFKFTLRLLLLLLLLLLRASGRSAAALGVVAAFMRPRLLSASVHTAPLPPRCIQRTRETPLTQRTARGSQWFAAEKRESISSPAKKNNGIPNMIKLVNYSVI